MIRKGDYEYNVFIRNSKIYLTRIHLKSKTTSMAEMPLQVGVEYDLDKLLQDAIDEGAFD